MGKKISELNQIDALDVDGSQLIQILDITDTSMSEEGTNKSMALEDAPISDAVQSEIDRIDAELLTVGGIEDGWDDLRVAAQSTKVGGSAPTWAKLRDSGGGSTGVYTYWFPDSGEPEVHFAVQIPHNWKNGTDLHPHVHWCTNVGTLGADRVCWNLEYTWANIGTGVRQFGNTTNIQTYNISNDPATTINAYQHYISSFDPIQGAGKYISTMLICRLSRVAGNVNDTLGESAAFLEFDLHYEVDDLGSVDEYDKNGAGVLDYPYAEWDSTPLVWGDPVNLAFENEAGGGWNTKEVTFSTSGALPSGVYMVTDTLSVNWGHLYGTAMDEGTGTTIITMTNEGGSSSFTWNWEVAGGEVPEE